jgi:hypothetical protein
MTDYLADRTYIQNGCQSIDGDQLSEDLCWGWYWRGAEVTFKENKPDFPCLFIDGRYRMKLGRM